VEDSYLRTSGDTLIFLMDMMDMGHYEEGDMAILPAPVGMTWTALMFDTIIVEMGTTTEVSLDIEGEVLGIETCTVPIGTFDDTYHIVHHMALEVSMPETTVTGEMDREYWAAEDIGPLKFFNLPVTSFGDPEPGELQELADYSVTAVEPEDILLIPVSFAAAPPYPNPFNPTTTIQFDLPIRSAVTITVADLRGSTVDLIRPGALNPGRYRYMFDGSHLSSGVYLVRIQTGQFESIQKMVLMK
jgi:hypothetical protein